MSANQYSFNLEQLPQLVGHPDEGYFRSAHVDFLSGAEQLVALRSFQKLLCTNLAQQLFRWSRPTMDLFQKTILWFDLKTKNSKHKYLHNMYVKCSLLKEESFLFVPVIN